ncbi:MAG: pyridoxal 5'-phosphate synthase glutaminase subunit PdxT [Acidobacteria bacterium]|nr:pyridoxal 5'-phosphate synthase glutaminase subunit PdxT [Acidobacteriota bacterium]
MPTIGVLALQGDFEAHQRVLQELGCSAPQVRAAKDLPQLDALVIPGGESTTMLKLLRLEDLLEPLRQFGLAKPIFGTCAGTILLASEVTRPEQESLALMDLTVERNAYGRQVHSQVTRIPYEGGELEAVFIRAPVIRRAGPGVQVLSEFQGTPVLVSEGRHLAATFHPELTADRRVHRLFLDRI